MGVSYSNYTNLDRQPPKSGYRLLQAIVNGVVSRAGALIELLDVPHRHGGNPGYPAVAMLSAYVMQFALRERYANAFLNRLGANPRLLAICGLSRAPSEGAYSQFKNLKLADHVDLIQDIIGDVFRECGAEIEQGRAEGRVPTDQPPLGDALVMDSTDVEAWARPGRTSRSSGEEVPSQDTDAQWGHRTAKTPRSRQSASGKRRRVRKYVTGAKESKDELYFGYKVNVIADANHGLPLFAATRPANASDVTALIPDLDDCLAQYPTLRPRYFLGDKGYDSLKNIQHLVSLGIAPVIAIRQPAKDAAGRRHYDGIYDAGGRPTCVGGQPMEYVETDLEKGHLFRCPAGGCHLKDSVQFTRHCDSEHYEKPEGRLLRIVGSLPRCSAEWQTQYRKRPVIERYFSSVKHSRLLDQHRCLDIRKVRLHVAMAMLTYLVTALARLQAGDYAGMRQMRIQLPPARGASRNRPLSSTPDCRNAGCACCGRSSDAA